MRSQTIRAKPRHERRSFRAGDIRYYRTLFSVTEAPAMNVRIAEADSSTETGGRLDPAGGRYTSS